MGNVPPPLLPRMFWFSLLEVALLLFSFLKETYSKGNGLRKVKTLKTLLFRQGASSCFVWCSNTPVTDASTWAEWEQYGVSRSRSWILLLIYVPLVCALHTRRLYNQYKYFIMKCVDLKVGFVFKTPFRRKSLIFIALKCWCESVFSFSAMHGSYTLMIITFPNSGPQQHAATSTVLMYKWSPHLFKYYWLVRITAWHCVPVREISVFHCTPHYTWLYPVSTNCCFNALLFLFINCTLLLFWKRTFFSFISNHHWYSSSKAEGVIQELIGKEKKKHARPCSIYHTWAT